MHEKRENYIRTFLSYPLYTNIHNLHTPYNNAHPYAHTP